jgi:5-methylcytosine-specific restriction endonuclease McrA
MLGRCLVLNQSAEFLDVCNWFEALCLVIENKATTLEHYSDVARSQHQTWKIPAVLQMRYYVHIKKRKNTFGVVNKRNLLIRDNFCCQYCGKALTPNTATIDHVIPRSKKGKHSLENTVCACKPCNNIKGDMSLSEFQNKFGLILKSEPRQLTDDEKINCLLKTVKAKERNIWLKCLKDNNISVY